MTEENQITEIEKNLFHKIAKANGFVDYNLWTGKGSEKGDGYLGIITLVQIEEPASKKKLNLILKSAQKGEDLRKKAPVQKAYQREIFMYDVVFPAFDKFQKECKAPISFKAYPKCYGVNNDFNNECLVLENLKNLGYSLWDRKKPMDASHVKLVFSEYAKFHAVSYAMKKLRPKEFEQLTKDLDDVVDGSLSQEDVAQSSINNLEKAFKAVDGDISAHAGLRRFGMGSAVFFRDIVKSKNKYSVITHGDCWCNNMMFEYEARGSSKIPVKVCLLDFQLAKVGSPILDLSYFFYTCASKIIIDNLPIYLKEYYDTLAQTLKQYNCNVADIMSFKDLQTQWKIYGKYGMYMAIMVLNIMLADSSDTKDVKQLVKDGDNVFNVFSTTSGNSPEYNKRLRDVICSMTRNHYL